MHLVGGEANFDRKISISCNMIFNTKSKIFKEKIVTYFSLRPSSQSSSPARRVWSRQAKSNSMWLSTSIKSSSTRRSTTTGCRVALIRMLGSLSVSLVSSSNRLAWTPSAKTPTKIVSMDPRPTPPTKIPFKLGHSRRISNSKRPHETKIKERRRWRMRI